MPSRSNPVLLAAIGARRDRVAVLYRAGLSIRAIADQLGIHHATVRTDLVAMGEPRRPPGWRRYGRETLPEHRQRLQEGNALFRAEVERVKAERGLLDLADVVEWARRAEVFRSAAAIRLHVAAGLLERERGLGFDKPWLFTVVAVQTYIARLRDHPDKRLRRFTPGISLRAEIYELLIARSWLTVKEIAAPRSSDPPGVGGTRWRVAEVLDADPELFERRSGKEVRELGLRRRSDAVVWAVRPGRQLVTDPGAIPEQAIFRDEWHSRHFPHKPTAEVGRQAKMRAALNGKKPGPKVKLAPEEIDAILALRARGKSQEQIRVAVGVSRKQVRGVLDSRIAAERG